MQEKTLIERSWSVWIPFVMGLMLAMVFFSSLTRHARQVAFRDSQHVTSKHNSLQQVPDRGMIVIR